MKKYRKLVNIILITIICILMCSSISCVQASGLEEAVLGGAGNQPQQEEEKKPTLPGKGEMKYPDEVVEDPKYLEDPISNPDFYKPVDKTGENTQFINIGNILIGTMRVVGIVISVVILMVIGLKYMIGTTAEKAAYKQTMIPYLVGAIMLFIIPTILGIIYDLVNGLEF